MRFDNEYGLDFERKNSQRFHIKIEKRNKYENMLITNLIFQMNTLRNVWKTKQFLPFFAFTLVTIWISVDSQSDRERERKREKTKKHEKQMTIFASKLGLFGRNWLVEKSVRLLFEGLQE